MIKHDSKSATDNQLSENSNSYHHFSSPPAEVRTTNFDVISTTTIVSDNSSEIKYYNSFSSLDDDKIYNEMGLLTGKLGIDDDTKSFLAKTLDGGLNTKHELVMGEEVMALLNKLNTTVQCAIPSEFTSKTFTTLGEGLAASLGKLDGNSFNLQDTMKEATKGIFSGASDIGLEIGAVIILCASMKCFAWDGDWRGLLGIVASAAYIYFFGKAIRNTRVWTVISDTLLKLFNIASIKFKGKDKFNDDGNSDPQEEKIYTQSGIDNDYLEDIGTGVMAILTAYTTFTTGKDVPTNLCKGLFSFDRTKRSMLDIVQVIIKYFEKVVNWVRTDIMHVASLRFVNTNIAALNYFFDELEEFYDEERRSDGAICDETYSKIIGFHNQATKFMREIPIDRNSAQARSMLSEQKNRLYKMKVKYEELQRDLAGFRMEPVGILFRGGPGAGKSILMDAISKCICASIFDEKTYKKFQGCSSNYVYNRFSEMVYWDQYKRSAFIVMFDDFGQSKVVPGVPDNEFMNFIRAVNSFRYDLHMASLEEKGNAHFSAKFVIATTNLQNWDSAISIHDYNAIQRRFAFDILVTPHDSLVSDETKNNGAWDRKFHPDIKNGTHTEAIKMRNNAYKELGMDPPVDKKFIVEPYMQKFFLRDESGRYSKEVTFADMIELFVERYRSNMAWYNTQVVTIKDMSERFRSKYVSEYVKPESNPIHMQSIDEFDEFTDASDGSDEQWLQSHISGMRRKTPNIDCSDILESDWKLHFDDDIIKLMNLLRTKYGPYMKDDIRSALKMIGQDLYSYSPTNRYIEDWLRFCIVLSDLRRYDKDHGNETYLFEVFLDYITKSKIQYIMFICKTISKNADAYVMTIPRLVSSYKNILPKIGNSVSKAWYGFWEKTIAYFADVTSAVAMGDALALFNKLSIPLVLLITSGLGISFLKSFKSLWTSIVPGYETYYAEFESKDFAKEKHNWKATHKTVTPRMMRGVNAIAQRGTVDSNGLDFITGTVYSNMYTMEVESDIDTWVKLGSVVFVIDTVALMPFHFARTFTSILEDDPNCCKNKIRLSGFTKGGQKKVKFCMIEDVLNHIYGDNMIDSDVCLVKFPQHIQPHKSRIDTFFTEEDITSSNFTKHAYVLARPEAKGPLLNHGMAQMNDVPVYTSDPQGKTSDWMIRRTIRYDNCTTQGDCGAILCLPDTNYAKKKIAGIHVAGGRGHSYANICTQEMINEALKEVEAEEGVCISNEDIPEDIYTESGMSIGDGQFDVKGKVKPAPIYPTHTSIYRSVLHNSYTETDLMPAPLYSSEGPSPLFKAVEKYGKNYSFLRTDILKTAIDDYSLFLEKNARIKVERRILDLWTVIYGDDSDFYRGLPKKTSPGYPMNTIGHDNLKKKLWPAPKGKNREDDPDHVFWTLHDRVEIDLGLLKRGQRPLYIFNDFPKDETLPSRKVKNGQARMISGSPLIYTCISRMYNGAFDAFYMENRIDNGSSIGINPYSSEWHDIVMYLGIFEPNKHKLRVNAGDYSGFDRSHNAQTLLAANDIINTWYADGRSKDIILDENRLVRDTLFLEIHQSRHICDGLLHVWSGGMPSGGPCTATINTLINNLIVRYCWYVINPYTEFNEHVRMLAYGDDIIWNTSDTMTENFNDAVLEQTLRVIGYTYTDETKKAVNSKKKHITDIEFLKRGFRYESVLGRWIGHQNLNVILNTPMWSKRGSEYMKITITNVGVALRELSLHSKATWEEWSYVFKEVFIRFGLDESYLDFPLNIPKQKLMYMVTQDCVVSTDGGIGYLV